MHSDVASCQARHCHIQNHYSETDREAHHGCTHCQSLKVCDSLVNGTICESGAHLYSLACSTSILRALHVSKPCLAASGLSMINCCVSFKRRRHLALFPCNLSIS